MCSRCRSGPKPGGYIDLGVPSCQCGSNWRGIDGRITCNPVNYDLVWYSQRPDKVERIACLGQQLVEQNSLRSFAGEAVQDPVLSDEHAELVSFSAARHSRQAMHGPTNLVLFGCKRGFDDLEYYFVCK